MTTRFRAQRASENVKQQDKVLSLTTYTLRVPTTKALILKCFSDGLRAEHFWEVAYAGDKDDPELRTRLLALGQKNRKHVPGLPQAQSVKQAKVSPAMAVVAGLAYDHLAEYYRFSRAEYEIIDVDSLDSVALRARLIANNYLAAYLWEYVEVVEANDGKLLWPVYELLPKDGARAKPPRSLRNAPSYDAQDFY